jgi:hypothetical protein
MENKKLKNISLLTLISGYIFSIAFVLLIIANTKSSKAESKEVLKVEDKIKIVEAVKEFKKTITYEVKNVADPVVTVVGNDPLHVGKGVIRGGRDIVIDDAHRIGAVEGGLDGNGYTRGDRARSLGNNFNRTKEDVYDKDVDLGLLDRRIAEQDLFRDDTTEITKTTDKKFGLDKDEVNLANLTVANNRGDDAELGEVDLSFDGNKNGTFGLNKGELYAYNFPSQGVGAGIGNSAVGSGPGIAAGLGAGIGEGIYNGETVPTLGGVGTYRPVPLVEPGTGTDVDNDGLEVETELALGTDPTKSDSDGDGYSDGEEIASYTSPSDPASNPGTAGSSAPSLGGVGGLINGAGSGVAAGLITGMMKPQLGVSGIAPGAGIGDGNYIEKGNYNLPQDGALHIMMHVDGSGSILNTRKQLEIMKNTLLKKELLPYYNNDEDLYNKRVTIVDGNGERTFQFFAEAAKKDNVLALVFQDEAQPAYHLPNFNKKPEDHYMDDLGKLKNKLNGYGGLYRGIMFQVDRGKTFAKSFKEFVGNAFKGTGYLEKENLKKYYYQDNEFNIKNKNGIVFSDEYHAKDSGSAEYYLNLIINASKKIGLDLKAPKGGLTDGKYIKN